jgi:hypothetical protein
MQRKSSWEGKIARAAGRGVGDTSGAGLFAIASEGVNLLTQQGGSTVIATGEGHGKRELELFKLMFPFAGELARKMTAGGGRGRTACGP